jgi:hypothetical protein
VCKGQTILNDTTKTASVSGIASFSFSATDSGIVTLVPGKVPVVNKLPANAPDRAIAIKVSGKTVTVFLNPDAETDVSARMFDCRGKMVFNIVTTRMAAGRHTIQRNIPGQLAAGGYVVVCKDGRQTHAAKIVVGR